MVKPTILERNKIKLHQASVKQEVYHSADLWNYWEDIDISSDNPKYINFKNSAVEIPYGDNDSLILSSSTNISSEYQQTKETNKLQLGSGSIGLSTEYFQPKETNKLQLGSGSIGLSSEYDLPKETNKIDLGTGSIEISSEYNPIHESGSNINLTTLPNLFYLFFY